MTTTTISRSSKGLTLTLSQIEIPPTARPYNAMAVVELSRSIAAIGLQSAPTVIEREGRFILVAGSHRIEALKMLGIPSVLVRCVDFDDVEARMWTIAENLFRAELTVGHAPNRSRNMRDSQTRSATFILRKLRRMTSSGKTVAVIAMKAATALRLATWASAETKSAAPRPSLHFPNRPSRPRARSGSTITNPLS
jgi:ParB-like chromosome segregation protein Spo0J